MGADEKPLLGKDLVTLDQVTRLVAASRIDQKDWSGLPIPVPGLDLVIEPRYKHKDIDKFRWKECFDENGVRHQLPEEKEARPSDFKRVNSWWNFRYQATVVVIQDKEGRSCAGLIPEDRLAFMIRTLDAAAVWPVDAERKAQAKLATLVEPQVFDIYMLTGHFAEMSLRSQVTYIFRRGRPTIAIREHEDMTIPLCALCLHPIGYYGDTWAGVMCPTDEVIAHLLMMRGSEEKFWANANQHPIDNPRAGI